MHQSVLDAFTDGLLTHGDVNGRTVLEVGAADVNGSVRPLIESLGPAGYVGVDRSDGKRVDRVVDCGDLRSTFGESAFDVVVTTEMLEHVYDWRRCIHNLAAVTGDLLVVTTRSPGFPYHPFPNDYWRFPPNVMRRIIKAVGFEVLACYPDPDPLSPGVIVKARKPAGWKPYDNPFTDPSMQPSRVGDRPTLNWYRSWPSEVPPDRAYVQDNMPRLIMRDYDYDTVADLPSDEPGWCMLEWDVALDVKQRNRFAEIALESPDRPLVAPYYKVYDPEKGPEVLCFLLQGQNGTIPEGHPVAHMFGFGCIYFPQHLVRDFLATKPTVPNRRWSFNDTRFSRWHFKQHGETKVTWDIHPQHLHGD